jgi:lambda repressor-like predicted transcriptional regulator
MSSNLALTESSIHPWITSRMNKLGIPSLRQLAYKAGLPAMTLHHGLTGRSDLSAKRAKKLADALEVSLDELLIKAELI